MRALKRFFHYRRHLGTRAAMLALAGKLKATNFEIEVHPPETTYPLHLRVPSSDVDAYRQIFVDADYDFSPQPPPRTIIDAGANVGLASVYFASKYQDATIVAVEPEPRNYELLARNTAGYANIVPVHAALWNRNELLNLFDPGLGEWGFMTGDKGANNLGSACGEVCGMTVDSLMDRYGLERLDILKMDIEGAEHEVFEDASSWIHRVDTLIIELHERLKPGCTHRVRASTADFKHEWSRGENLYLSRRSAQLAEPGGHKFDE